MTIEHNTRSAIASFEKVEMADACNYCGCQLNQTTDEGRCMTCGEFDEVTCGDCGLRLYTDNAALLCKCDPDEDEPTGLRAVGVGCLICGKTYKAEEDVLPCDCELKPEQKLLRLDNVIAMRHPRLRVS
jgi:hypothetical protein